MKVANQKNARKVAFQAAVAQQNAGGNLSDLSGTEKKIRKIIYIYSKHNLCFADTSKLLRDSV